MSFPALHPLKHSTHALLILAALAGANAQPVEGRPARPTARAPLQMPTADSGRALQDDAVKSLIQVLTAETRQEKLNDFSEGLGATLHTRLPSSGYQALLSGLAQSSDARVRRRAVATLPLLKTTASTALVRRALKDSDLSVAMEAAAILGGRGERNVADVYNRALRAHPGKEQRYIILASLKRVHYKWAVNPLRTFLRDSDPFLRVEACEALCRLGDEQAFMELRKSIRQGNKYLRSNAYAVVKEAAGPRVVPILTKALRDKDPSNRLFAAVCLARVNSARGLSVLQGALSHGTPTIRFTVVDALAVLEDPRVVGILRKTLKDADEDVVVRASEALVTKGYGSLALPALSKVMRASKTPVRLKALAAARAMGAGGEELLQAALSDRSRLVRLAAVDALSSFAEIKNRQRLQQASQDGDAGVRVAATILLVRLGDAKARALLDTFVDPQAPEHAETARALEHGKSTELVPYLQKLATTAAETVSLRAVAALGQQGSGPAAEALGSLTQPSHPEAVRRAAVDALGATSGDLATYLLKRLLDESTPEEMRAAAAAYLGDRGDRSATPLLKQELAHDDVRAARALCRMGDPSGIPVYRKVLQSGTPAERVDAAVTLYRLAHVQE